MSRADQHSSSEPERPTPRTRLSTAFHPPEVVVLDVETRRVHVVRDADAAVWMLLHDGRSTTEIAAEIAEIFSVDSAHASDAVEHALGVFRSLGLLVVGGEISGPEGRLPQAGAELETEPVVLARPPDP